MHLEEAGASAPSSHHLTVSQEKELVLVLVLAQPPGAAFPAAPARHPKGTEAKPLGHRPGLLNPVTGGSLLRCESKSPAGPGTLGILAPRCFEADWERNQKSPAASRDERGSLPVIMKIFTVADAWRKLKNNTTKFTQTREELKRNPISGAQVSHWHRSCHEKTDWEPEPPYWAIELPPGP